jgi:hypothetical protein
MMHLDTQQLLSNFGSATAKWPDQLQNNIKNNMLMRCRGSQAANV